MSKNITHENTDRQIEFIIIPHFNKYLNHHMDSTIEDYSKGKSKLPLLHNLITKKQWRMDEVFVISLEGAFIGSEKELNKIL